ncbi:MAG: hypothetical protein M3Q65_10755 [Chloroflexota bacterium]|nr:hypothetical protein [Chloroflexota bacterium]
MAAALKGFLGSAAVVAIWILVFLLGSLIVGRLAGGVLGAVLLMLFGSPSLAVVGIVVGRLLGWPAGFFMARWVTSRFEDWRNRHNTIGTVWPDEG